MERFGTARTPADVRPGPTAASIERVAARQAAEVGYLAIVRPFRCQLMSAFVSSMKTPSQPPACTSASTFESHFD